MYVLKITKINNILYDGRLAMGRAILGNDLELTKRCLGQNLYHVYFQNDTD